MTRTFPLLRPRAWRLPPAKKLRAGPWSCTKSNEFGDISGKTSSIVGKVCATVVRNGAMGAGLWDPGAVKPDATVHRKEKKMTQEDIFANRPDELTKSDYSDETHAFDEMPSNPFAGTRSDQFREAS